MALYSSTNWTIFTKSLDSFQLENWMNTVKSKWNAPSHSIKEIVRMERLIVFRPCLMAKFSLTTYGFIYLQF